MDLLDGRVRHGLLAVPQLVEQAASLLRWQLAQLHRLLLVERERKDLEAVAAVVGQCHALSTLHLAGCFHVTDASFEDVQATALAELSLAGCVGVGDAGIALLATKLCRSLQVIVLSGTSATDDGVVELAQRCAAQLRIVDAKGCGGVGNRSLVALAEHCALLLQVDLRACSIISEDSIALLEARVPTCQLLVNQQLRNVY